MKNLSIMVIISLLFLAACEGPGRNGEESSDILHAGWAERLSDSFIDRHPGAVVYDSLFTKKKWNYEQGLILEAFKQMYYHTGDEKYYNFIYDNISQFVDDDGNIRTYKMSDYNLDNINPGRSLLFLYQRTGEDKFKLAADILWEQLKNQPRTPSGGFWHKKRYPNQMWLDGIYMAEPFYAQYSKLFGENKSLMDIYRQFALITKQTRDEKTGLFYHAWDESKEQKWANPETGTSPHFWGRAMGWYMMAIVDVLDFIPPKNIWRGKLTSILSDLSDSLLNYQDRKTHLWYQVVNLPEREGNYLESSASAMYAYAFAKGYNMGYLSKKYLDEAKLVFEGLVEYKTKIDDKGYVNLYGTCSSAGLGGDPYRDGSFEYYISEPTRMNDIKGYGPFILAAIELERSDMTPGAGKTVVLDYYYNNERRENKNGEMERYHYTWEDKTNSGYYELGKIFTGFGAEIKSMDTAPDQESLSDADIYIIVDPDTPEESANPNYIEEPAISAVRDWVNAGGVLITFANDKGNAEFEHFNDLMKEFGIRYNEVSINQVDKNEYKMGQFINLPDHPIFKGVTRIYMKEISTIGLDSPHYSILKKDDDTVIAFKAFGKGRVLAISDPWLYNEYIDNRKLPAGFENYLAAQNMVKWILGITHYTE